MTCPHCGQDEATDHTRCAAYLADTRRSPRHSGAPTTASPTPHSTYSHQPHQTGGYVSRWPWWWRGKETMMPERTDPWPHERLTARMAVGILQRGEQLPENMAAACAIGLYRMTRDMEAEPCQHDSLFGANSDGVLYERCMECGEWFTAGETP